jgi:hypothetical protein
MSSRASSWGWLVFALTCALTTSRPAMAGDPPSVHHVVLYQCAGEPARTFAYDGTGGFQGREAPMEARWYWGRMRADRGEGCKIVAVDGQPFQSP